MDERLIYILFYTSKWELVKYDYFLSGKRNLGEKSSLVFIAIYINLGSV